MSKKPNFYDIVELLDKKCPYNLLFGERTNGKSFQVKKVCLWEAYHELDYLEFFKRKKKVKKKRYMFSYIRRWEKDLKIASVEKYFEDFEGEKLLEITNGEYSKISVWRGELFFSNHVDGKLVRGKRIGTVMALTMCEHYKSLSFPKIGNMFLEEFTTREGYLPHEVDNLTSIISTVARLDFVRIFLVGNTVDRTSPYFTEWQLTGVKKQVQGTIDIYHIKKSDESGEITLAAEYCENAKNENKLFFGKSGRMITTGEWESKEYPHLEKRLETYIKHYEAILKWRNFCWSMNLLTTKEKKEPFVYVYPKSEFKDNGNMRIISDFFSTNPLVTSRVMNITKYDDLLFTLIDMDKVCYSDNLTGTEFTSIYKELS